MTFAYVSLRTFAFASGFCWSPRLGFTGLGTCRQKRSPLYCTVRVCEPLEGQKTSTLSEASATQQAEYGKVLLKLQDELRTCRLEKLPLSDRSLQALAYVRGAQQAAKERTPLPHLNRGTMLANKQLLQWSPGCSRHHDVPVKLFPNTIQGELGGEYGCFQDERIEGNCERAQAGYSTYSKYIPFPMAGHCKAAVLACGACVGRSAGDSERGRSGVTYSTFFLWEGGGVVASDKSVWCDRAPRALLSPVLTSSSGPVVARIKQRHAFDGSDCAQEICESDCAQDWNAVNNRGAGPGDEHLS